MALRNHPGSDALLISASKIPSDILLKPTLGPNELQKLALGARYNTDDYPWIEFESFKWINRSTGTTNRQIIESYTMSTNRLMFFALYVEIVVTNLFLNL